jgi:hypothetical protein
VFALIGGMLKVGNCMRERMRKGKRIASEDWENCMRKRKCMSVSGLRIVSEDWEVSYDLPCYVYTHGNIWQQHTIKSTH